MSWLKWRKSKGKLIAPNCPACGMYMDKVEAWVCRKCGRLRKVK